MKFINALILCILFVGSLFSAEGDPVGKVIAIEGQAQANERNLIRGASVFVSDLIKVAAASKIQIRFTDGGILNLIENAQFRINSYAFNQDGKNEFIAELATGGFRALSGSIANSNPDGYAVKTPVATIGIRGTIFEANIVKGQTYFGCMSGSIRVANEAGERILAAGEFVTAASPFNLGDVTTVRPPALRNDLFTPPTGGEQIGPGPSGAAEIRIQLREDEGNPPC